MTNTRFAANAAQQQAQKINETPVLDNVGIEGTTAVHHVATPESNDGLYPKSANWQFSPRGTSMYLREITS